MKAIRASLLLLPLLGLLACASTSGMFDSDAVESDPLANDPDVLWEVVKVTLTRSKFDIDGDESNAGKHRLVTKWKEQLMPFRFQGTRQRITVEVHPSTREGAEGMYAIQVLVETEQNENIQDPMNSAVAEWKSTESDPVIAEALIYRVQTYLK